MSKVFISYSHEDEKWKDRVVKQLGVLAHEGKLEVWDDRRIAGGDDWFPEIEEAIRICDVALLLISAAFLTSKFILGKEIPPILERRVKAGVRVIPVILSPCAWTHVSWLKGIQARPIDGKALSSMTRNKAELALSALAEEVLQLTTAPIPTPLALSTQLSAVKQIAPTRLSHGAEHLFGRETELKLLDQAWENPATHILTFVAFGGVGKTSLLIEWMARKAATGWPGMERVFDWSFYSQGTREQGSPSADIFIKEALIFFGDRDMAESPASAWDKGARLAQLIADQPTLLVLDGLEPLQYPPGPMAGKLKDPIIETLLKGLNRQNPGLCIVTTRDSLEDLKAYRDTTAPEKRLEFLSDVAGAAVLHQAGAQRAGAVEIKADDAELLSASREVAGHALTLKLLGNYLALAANGDIRRRSEVRFEEADREYGAEEDKPYGHAFKVMSAYEKWFTGDGKDGRRKVAVLRLLGLFDGPADFGCIESLRKPPAIRGLTEDLADQGRAKWQITLAYLARCGLVTIRDNSTLDAHPLIREYFAKILRDNSSAAWRAGHKRLYEYLTKITKDKQLPTLDDLLPLYQAVSHGCLAGIHKKAFEMYRDRISKKENAYVVRKLGAFGVDLGAVVCFFEQLWRQVSSALSVHEQAWLLNAAAYRLRSMGVE